MRLPGCIIMTAVMVIALNFSTAAVCARGGNSAGPGNGQHLLKNQSSHQTGQQNRKNQNGSRSGNSTDERSRLRDGSCVKPSLYGK